MLSLLALEAAQDNDEHGNKGPSGQHADQMFAHIPSLVWAATQIEKSPVQSRRPVLRAGLDTGCRSVGDSQPSCSSWPRRSDIHSQVAGCQVGNVTGSP